MTWTLVVLAFCLGWTLRSWLPDLIGWCTGPPLRCARGHHDFEPIDEPNAAIAHHWVQCRRCGVVEFDR